MMLTEDYDSVGTASKSPLDGVWKLSKAFHVNGKDTVNKNITEFKVYEGGYFIWGLSGLGADKKNYTTIGYGKFEIDGNKVKELLMASTSSQMRDLDFAVDVEFIGDDGFKQTINNKDGSKDFEVYQRVKK
jgi:hypothetical protein